MPPCHVASFFFNSLKALQRFNRFWKLHKVQGTTKSDKSDKFEFHRLTEFNIVEITGRRKTERQSCSYSCLNMIKSDLFLVCFTVILLMFETYFVFWGFLITFTDHRCVLAKLPGGLLCGPVAHTASKLLPGHHTSYYGGCHRWAKRQRLLRFQPAGELKVIIYWVRR